MAVPVQAPYNTNPSYSGNFIPEIWSGKLNVKFYETTVLGEIANTDWEGDLRQMGDKVHINNIPSITINDYVVGGNLTYEVPAPEVIELVIDKAKAFGFGVNDVLAFQSQPDLMDMFSQDAAKQMAITIDRAVLSDIFSQGASANKGATAGVISGGYNLGTDAAPVTLSDTTTIPLIVGLSSVLDEQNVPDTDRFLVIPPFMRQWLMRSPLAQAYVTGDGQSILRNGKIGTIDRFTIYVSNLLPQAGNGLDFDGNTQGGAVARQAIIAGHKSALTFASNFAATEHLPNPTDFGQLVRGVNVYGYKMVKPQAFALGLVK